MRARASGLFAALCCAGAMLAVAPGTAFATGWTASFGSGRILPAGPPSADARASSVAIGDVTGDGRPDAVLSVFDAAAPAGAQMHLVVFAQRTDGMLADAQRLALPDWSNQDMGLAIGDVDGDGTPDVAVPMQAGLEVYAGHDGTLSGPTVLSGSPRDERDVLLRDMNGDGRNDLVISTDSGPWVLTGGPGGTYTPRQLSTYGLPQIGAGDVNGDGRPDVVGMTVVVDPAQSTYHGELRRFLQQPDGTYAMQTTTWAPGHAGGLAVGDFTADGRDDVAVSRPVNAPDASVQLFAQAGGSLTSPPVVYGSDDIPQSLATADLDGDGRGDLVTAHGGWDAVGVYLQRASGGLGPEQLLALPDNSASQYGLDAVAVGDLSCDGRPDLAIADSNYGLLLIPQTPPPGVAPGSACPGTAAPPPTGPPFPPATGTPPPPNSTTSTAPSPPAGNEVSPAAAAPPSSSAPVSARRCVVPRLVRHSLAAARRLLARSGCGRPSVARRRVQHGAAGVVLSQSPRAGVQRTHGARVALVLSSRA